MQPKNRMRENRTSGSVRGALGNQRSYRKMPENGNLYKMMPKKIQNLRGFLCKSFEDNFFFRTYKEDGSFVDYEICHSDLEIQILDKDAYIYTRDGKSYIDYSPKTLGTEKEIG